MSRRRSRGASVGGLLIGVCAALSLGQRPVVSTGRLSGVVVIDGTQGTPVRGAIVTVSGAGLSRARSVLTDEAGSFVVEGLPPGRYTVSASKAPFVPMAFGATRPGRQGTAIVVAGQAIDDVTIRLPRGGVITGVLRDQGGQVAPDVEVWALRSIATIAEAPLSAIPLATTDEHGVYRIYGLPAGDYFVAATFRVTGVGDLTIPSTEEMDQLFAALQRPTPSRGGAVTPAVGARPAEAAPPPRVFGYAPTFFPGAVSAADAESVTVVAGEERRADFSVGPVPTGTVEGAIETDDGTSLPPVIPSLMAQGALALPMFGAQPTLAMRPGPDGHFTFTGVAPGKYVLSAATGSGDSARWAIVDLTSTGDDLTGITLTLRPGMHLSGTVVVEGGAAPAVDLTTLRLVLTATRRPIRLNLLTSPMPVSATGSARADGAFVVAGILPGSYTISGQGLGRWFVRSAMVDGRDAVDVPIEFANGADLTDAIVTLSDRSSEVSGTLQTAARTSATEYFVVVFSTDPSVWRPGARRVRSTRPASDGRFVVSDLPGGDYYIAALTDVTSADLADAAFLAQVAPSAVRVTLADGEKKTQDFRIGGGG